MAIHEKIIYESGKIIIHFVGVFQQDYALCGQDLAGDTDITEGKYYASSQTYKKVNCPYCIRITEYCKKIKNDEYEKRIQKNCRQDYK